MAELEASGVTVKPHSWVPGCLELSGTGDLTHLPAFREGKFLVQIKCCTSGNCDRIYEDVLNSDGSAVVPDGYISLWSDAATLQSKFKYYFVLRPSQLAQ